MIKRLARYFLQGVLFTVPISVTAYVIFILFGFIDDLLPFKLKIPGLGLVILLATITLIGFMGNTFIAHPFKYWFNRLLAKAPIVKTVYTTIGDFTASIIGDKKKKFSQPVLVKLSEHIEKPGFITLSDMSSWGLSNEKVMVYLPHSYGFTGNIFVVPKKNITPLNIRSAEMMKIILSGGVSESKPEED